MESYCSEENSFDIELPNGYTSLHVEYACDEDVATPTGRYFVYMMENDHGTSMFHLQMDDNGQWVSENKPPFLHRSDI